jgi:hypothetical protein
MCVSVELCGYASMNIRTYLLIHGAGRDCVTESVTLTVHSYDGFRTPSSNGSRPIGGINNLLNGREYCHRAMTGQHLAHVWACVCVCVCVCVNTFSRLQLNPPSNEITCWETATGFNDFNSLKTSHSPNPGIRRQRVSVTTNVSFQITPKHTTKNTRVLSNPWSVTNSISWYIPSVASYEIDYCLIQFLMCVGLYSFELQTPSRNCVIRTSCVPSFVKSTNNYSDLHALWHTKFSGK